MYNEFNYEKISRKEAIRKGAKIYYSSKPCEKGHGRWRFTSGSGCVSCKNENLSFWKAKNRHGITESSLNSADIRRKAEDLRERIKLEKEMDWFD